ncbi:MAG: hypothetical protein ACRCSU_07900 [Paracoccaceae bacterium]
MSESKVRVKDDYTIVGRRTIPLPHLLITATTSGTAQTFYTVRDETVLQVTRLAVVNVTGSAATFSLHSIPSGGAIGNGNAELLAVSVPANSAANLTEYLGGAYEGGTTLKVYSGTGSALVVHGTGEEIL